MTDKHIMLNGEVDKLVENMVTVVRKQSVRGGELVEPTALDTDLHEELILLRRKD